MENIRKFTDDEFREQFYGAVITAKLNDEIMGIDMPINSSYGDSLTNIYFSLLGTLSDDAKYYRVLEETSKNDFKTILLYFEVEKVKIYCLIEQLENSVSSENGVYIQEKVQTIVAFEGIPEDIDVYWNVISDMFNTIFSYMYENC